MLKINQIYKVKEGHEWKCDRYRGYEGAFIRITGNDKHGIIYSIFDKNNIRVSSCKWCFTEKDLELEEEVKEKSLEDLEVGDEVYRRNFKDRRLKVIDKAVCVKLNDGFENWKSMKEVFNNQWKLYITPAPKEMSPSEAETLLEEKLGIKVKIKN